MTTSGVPLTIASTLRRLQAQGLDRLDAQLLLLHALDRDPHDRAWLLAHDTDPFDASVWQRLKGLAQRRAQGEPVAYLIGHQEFFGLDLIVDPCVLVPRPDTETLVEWALEVLPDPPGAAPAVLDLGTGSGAIALALKHSRPNLQVSATDFSEEALAVANSNARRLGLAVRFLQGSWFDALEHGTECFYAIVSNPPYIAAADPHLVALGHEPLQALVGGGDGLDDLRHIISSAVGHLHPGGWLLLEHGYDQAALVRGLLGVAGLTCVQSRRDLGGIERCSAGQWLPKS